jgi:hypothetical protein
MARKLYIFKPTGRTRVDGQQGATKWLGGYSANYTYLGDPFAKMLGAGHYLPTRRVPAWIHTHAASAQKAKGGASRHDPGFRGWG